MAEFLCASCGSDNEISALLPLICEICGCAETSDHVIKPYAAMRYPSVPVTSGTSYILDPRTSEEPGITKPARRLKLGAAGSTTCSANKAAGPGQVHQEPSAGGSTRNTRRPALVPALKLPVLAPSLPDYGPHSEHRARAAGDGTSRGDGTEVAEAATQGIAEQKAQDQAPGHCAGSVRGGQVTATMYTFSTALLESGGGCARSVCSSAFYHTLHSITHCICVCLSPRHSQTCAKPQTLNPKP